jgi:hypothetical protein
MTPDICRIHNWQGVTMCPECTYALAAPPALTGGSSSFWSFCRFCWCRSVIIFSVIFIIT